MYNLQYSGIITSLVPKTEYILGLDGLLIRTETNPYYQYFDPYFVTHTYTLSSFDDSGEMRFLYIDKYTYPLPTKIAFLENTMYRMLRREDESYNYRIYRFLHDTL